MDKTGRSPRLPAGWERGFGESGHTVVALKDQEIIGWANYWPEPQGGGFGPVGVLEAFRGYSIGSCLLLESMLRMKELGVLKATAGWAVTDFYLKNGWEICRQYAPFQKKIAANLSSFYRRFKKRQSSKYAFH